MFQLNGFTDEQLADINAELRLGWARKAVEAELWRQEIAKLNQAEVAWGDDMQLTMRVDRTVALYWQAREGRDVWQDSSHLKYFKRHFPEIFVKSVAPKTRVGYVGNQRDTNSTNGHEEAQEGAKIVDQFGRAAAAAA